jgi:hypothetical protein
MDNLVSSIVPIIKTIDDAVDAILDLPFKNKKNLDEEK